MLNEKELPHRILSEHTSSETERSLSQVSHTGNVFRLSGDCSKSRAQKSVLLHFARVSLTFLCSVLYGSISGTPSRSVAHRPTVSNVIVSNKVCLSLLFSGRPASYLLSLMPLLTGS